MATIFKFSGYADREIVTKCCAVMKGLHSNKQRGIIMN